MTNKEIAERATKALHLFETSKPNDISNYDLIQKTNEALRLIKALAETDGR
jgi:hypothetical protein